VIGMVAALLVVAGCQGTDDTDSATSTAPTSDPPGTVVRPEVDRPNIVLFLTDDQALEDLAVMPKTRRLIGDTGVTFNRTIAEYPLCCPTRATLLTGQLPHNHGVMGNNPPWGGYGRFDPSETVPMWLQDRGYRTALVGKLMNGYPLDGRPRQVDPGWTDWHVPTKGAYDYQRFTVNENGRLVKHRQYQTDWLGDTLSSLTRKYARTDDPFFLYGAFLAPHYGKPRDPDDPPGSKTPSPAAKYRDTVTAPLVEKPNRPETDLSDKNPWLFQERNRTTVTPGMAEVHRQRLESLKSVDDAVAQVVATLRETGELDDTLLVFTSDNGYMLGEHSLENQKIFGYEESLRVPLLMSGPGLPVGVERDQLVSLADLPATFLDVAGATPRLPLDGQSLTSYAEDPRHGVDRHLLLESGGWPGIPSDRMYTGIRTSDDRVLLRYWNGHLETYDLASDPYQLDGTTSDDEAEWRDELLAELDDLEDCVGEECSRYPE
jgi:N-acetylglucosamine-6-sulfatase